MLKRVKNALRQFSKSKMGIAGLIIIMIFVFIAVAAPMVSPYDPNSSFVGPRFSPPSPNYILGTDDVGRDVLSQIIYGSRISILIGVASACIGTLLGTIIRLFSGYFGGFVDDVLMRTTDIFLIIPFIPLAVLFALYIGPSLWLIILLLGFFGWPPAARQVRSQILSLKESAFVETVRALGASHMHIIFRHLLPNVIGLILADVTLRTVYAILAEAGLAFIGVFDPTIISWGTILYFGLRMGALYYGAWWTIVPAGFCIALLGCGFAFLGHGITLVLNPKLAGRYSLGAK